MKADWLKPFAQYLMKRAPILQTDGYGQSRKINDWGWPYAPQEIRCYGKIHYYVERGLGSHKIPIAQVLATIHDFQKYHERGPYTAYFNTFGFTADTLRRRTKELYPHTKMTDLAVGVCGLSGTIGPEIPCVVRVLRTPESEDLQVFLCKDRSVKLHINLAQRYRQARERTVWFFLGEDAPQWDSGVHFKPDFIELVSVDPQ
jgi:hypothetical protein